MSNEARELGWHPGKTVHNAYLWAAAELGLIGLVPFLVIQFLGWRDFSRVWQAGRRPGSDPGLAQLSLRAGFVQIAFFGGLIDAALHPTLFAKIPWLVLGLSSALMGLARTRIAELNADEGRRQQEAQAHAPPGLASRDLASFPR